MKNYIVFWSYIYYNIFKLMYVSWKVLINMRMKLILERSSRCVKYNLTYMVSSLCGALLYSEKCHVEIMFYYGRIYEHLLWRWYKIRNNLSSSFVTWWQRGLQVRNVWIWAKSLACEWRQSCRKLIAILVVIQNAFDCEVDYTTWTSIQNYNLGWMFSARRGQNIRP